MSITSSIISILSLRERFEKILHLRNIFDSNYWAYLGAPILGIGSCLVMVGVLFNKHFET